MEQILNNDGSAGGGSLMVLATYTAGDIIGVAVDIRQVMDRFTFGTKNGTWQKQWWNLLVVLLDLLVQYQLLRFLPLLVWAMYVAAGGLDWNDAATDLMVAKFWCKTVHSLEKKLHKETQDANADRGFLLYCTCRLSSALHQ